MLVVWASHMTLRRAVLVCALASAFGTDPSVSIGHARADAPVSAKPKIAKIDFSRDIRPLLDQFCVNCHGEKKKGGLDLRVYTNESLALRDRAVFEKILSKLESHEMPPQNKPQPTIAQCEMLTNWVVASFFACDCNHPDPGRVTIRRLNRAEYNNTIRDLVGVDFQPAADFPADDSGYGFDNIGDVLSVSPVLMEKYLAAAEKIMNSVFDHAETDGLIAKGKNAAAYQRLMAPAESRAPKPQRAKQI